MAISKEWTEWHLTANGWIRGSYRIDGSGVHNKDTPEGSILTKRYREDMSSPFKKPTETIQDIWSSNYENKIKTLIEQFGDCPNTL